MMETSKTWFAGPLEQRYLCVANEKQVDKNWMIQYKQNGSSINV